MFRPSECCQSSTLEIFADHDSPPLRHASTVYHTVTATTGLTLTQVSSHIPMNCSLARLTADSQTAYNTRTEEETVTATGYNTVTATVTSIRQVSCTPPPAPVTITAYRNGSTITVTQTAPAGVSIITRTAPGGVSTVTQTAPGGTVTVTQASVCPTRGTATITSTSTCYETVTGQCPSKTPGCPVSPASTVYVTQSRPGGVTTVTESGTCPTSPPKTVTAYQTLPRNCPSTTPGSPVSPPVTYTVTETAPGNGPSTCEAQTTTITKSCGGHGGGWSTTPAGPTGPGSTTSPGGPVGYTTW